ncbi:class I poly(R)-hydroxyalkanoic acid synthase [Candidatus Phycosocius spiralis]|nr:class I poly(R)-hydroxyalkanoic acid synthase [Candidatus Phycosocius spiralis]
MAEKISRAASDPKGDQAAFEQLPPTDPATATTLLEALQAQNLESIESLTRNLGHALSKVGMLGVQAVDEVMADDARPLRADPYGLAPYAAEVTTRLVGNPEKMLAAHQDLWRGFSDLWTETVKISLGEEVDQEPKDKRFVDADWQTLPMFNLIQKTYLHTANWFTGLIDHVDGIDDMTRRKASFFHKQLADAFAPSNFLMTNPVALREALRTGGMSIVKGISNLEQDLKRGHGRLTPNQVDERPFKIGENIAISPGKIIHRGEIIEIIQYNPTTKTVFEIPILFFPPWINKFYILDLRQDNSMVKWLTEQGHSVFVVSWVNPGVEHTEKTFEDYARLGIFEALDAVIKATGQSKINTVGYCIGGTLLAATMAFMAKTGDDRINSATFFASQSDFEEAGDLKVFTDDAAIQYIKDEIEHAGGVLDATVMGETFNFLRANDLVWSFVVNNYLMGKDPKPFDLLFWNADQTRMPKALHLFYLDNFYRHNRLSKGEMSLMGHKLAMKDVTTPVYMQSSKEDHIAPWRSIFRGAKLFGGPVRMILAGSGHIAGVINHPAAQKYQHWLPSKSMTDLPATADQWQQSLEEFKGSWWPDWAIWLAERSGNQIPARVPGDGECAVLGDAPGTYVLVKSAS